MSASLRQLRYVCAVAEHGSFLRAAEAMHISQSSILAAVEAAESDLGARLFERRRAKGVVVTPAGERFLIAARQLLAAEQDFNTRVKGLNDRHGPLRIGCFEPFGSMFMVEVLGRLKAQVGPFNVEVMEADQPRLKRFLDRGEVDVALAYDLGPDFEGTITEICRAPPHAMVPLSSPLALKPSVSIEELAREPLVLLSQPLTVTYLLTLFDYAAQRPEVSFQSRSYNTVIRAVAAGFGCTVLNLRPPRPLEVESGCLRLPIDEALPGPKLIAVDRYGDRKPRLLNSFLEALAAYFDGPRPGALAAE
ncbi:LysR family transcriptional regulator [Oceanicella sp. SM1341]|uniref:LysR family transcriptional regulator n=1 Tax=Oceanicella sp. SM1341 TaxID=1548889 RepID=UPI000E532D90|nr:LysR family transcriptional regulator [Oceanicella sp. SM1341]